MYQFIYTVIFYKYIIDLYRVLCTRVQCVYGVVCTVLDCTSIPIAAIPLLSFFCLYNKLCNMSLAEAGYGRPFEQIS